MNKTTKTVFAVVCGSANAGKSSLVNLLVGEKVAIVSEKPQTTRTNINGVLTKDNTQYVFTDTPGLHKAKTALSRHMLKQAGSGIAGADVVLLIADAHKLSEKDSFRVVLPKELSSSNSDAVLLLNKVDLIKDKTKLLKIIDDYNKAYDFAEIIPISVKEKINIDKILPLLDSYAKNSDFYFDEAVFTDQPEKVWLAEALREKLLIELREEVPHGIAVQIETFERSKTNKGEDIIDLSAAIVCEKASHKGIVIGKQGEALKKIGSAARKEMEEYFECKVNMKLWVKVAEDWRNRENLINEYGLKSE